jgi:F0F1-type ATP synthase assembly protein I
MAVIPVPSQKQTESTRRPYWQALNLALQLGYMIVIPLVIFGLGGRWLDRKLGASPWFLLGGMAVAVGLTTIFLIRKFTRLIRDIEQTSNK